MVPLEPYVIPVAALVESAAAAVTPGSALPSTAGNTATTPLIIAAQSTTDKSFFNVLITLIFPASLK